MKLTLNHLQLSHFSFWTAYYLARFAARSKPIKANPYAVEWPEYRGWEAGIASIGVK